MKKTTLTRGILLGTLLGFWMPCSASIPSGYYSRLEGLSGVSLKKAVKNAARNHTAISYGDNTWEVFRESDTHYVGNQLVWWDMYSPDNVPVSSGHPGMNIEHSVANSWWGGTKNDAYKDLMHLNPSNSDANSRKSNYPLGEIATQTWTNGVTFVGKPKSGTCGGATYVYEPADEYKGDFARVFFYMFTIYDDISWNSQWDWMFDKSSDLLLKPWAYELLLKWAAADPVSQKEIDRNEAIFRHQRNRNPFIDCPELADHIWGSKKNQPFHYDGEGWQPGPEEPGEEPDIPDVPDVPDTPVKEGCWYAVSSSAELNETDRYVIVSIVNNVAMSTSQGSTGKYLLPCDAFPSFESESPQPCITYVPADIAVLTLTKSGSDWKVAIGNIEGEHLGYLKSTEAKNVTLTGNAMDSGTSVTILPSAEKTDFRYTYPGSSQSYYLEYNNQANGMRFTTYASGQEDIRLYRLVETDGDENENAGLGTGVAENADELIYGIFDVNGRKLAAESLSGLENGIYIVVTNFGARKVMK